MCQRQEILLRGDRGREGEATHISKEGGKLSGTLWKIPHGRLRCVSSQVLAGALQEIP